MPIKVLYIDDEPELCELFVDFFSSEDINIQAFSDTRLGLESAKATDFDLVFLDFRMPGINGDQVAHSIEKKIPFYIITGESEPVLTYPFTAVLSKPFDDKKIQQILKALLTFKSLSTSK